MKRNLIFCLLFIGFASASFAQVLVHISGHVYNINTQAVVPNHPVTIFADSTQAPYFGYNTVVTTNANGVYEVNIPITSISAQVFFHISTSNCNGTILSYTFWSSPANTQCIQNFYTDCGSTPPPCIANFVVNPCANTAGNCFHFEALGISSALQYYWHFGDGNTGVGTNVNHTYTQPGTYVACLYVFNQAINCYDSVCQTITIATTIPCSAAFTFTPCSNTSTNCFHFMGIPSPTGIPFQYHWSFGDGFYASTIDPVHTFLQSGTYTVCLTVYAGNCVDSVCQQITVTGQPLPCEASFTATVNPNHPSIFEFTNTSAGSGPYTVYWHFGDGSSATGQTVTHNYAQGGVYNVCEYIINTATNCYDSVCQTITVAQTIPCSANFTVIPCSTPNICFHFIAVNPNPTSTYFWTFGDGDSDTNSTTSHNYAQAGDYLVCLRVYTLDGCYDSVCQIVSGGNVPLYDISGQVYAGNNLLDHGKAKLFRLNGTNAAQLIGTTIIDSIGAYHFSQVPAGIYYVKAKPIQSSQYFGQYLPTYYPHNAHWGMATPIMIPPSNSPYNINLRPVISPIAGPGVIGGMISTGGKFTGAGLPAPDEDILLEPLSGDPYIFTTSNSNGEFSFDNLGYGTYNVYADITGLTTLPATVTLNAANPTVNNVNLVITSSQVVTGIQNIEENQQFNLYPNPASQEITLDLVSLVSENAIVTVSDLPGRQLINHSVVLAKGQNKISLDLSGLDSGSYLISIRNKQGSASKKFVVVK